jgi:hypothetical protein
MRCSLSLLFVPLLADNDCTKRYLTLAKTLLQRATIYSIPNVCMVSFVVRSRGACGFIVIWWRRMRRKVGEVRSTETQG